MRTENLAQGLASLGRNGDSMMVHMNPEEVLGLQNLAINNGTSLTINPETGMPEAFSLGGVFKSLIPTVAGAALTGLSGGALSPLTVGLMVGGGTALFTGDPMEGILAGFGGYGGGQLAKSIGNFGMSQAAGLSDDAASYGAEALAGTADAGLASGLDPKDVLGVGSQGGIKSGVDIAAPELIEQRIAGDTIFGRDALAKAGTPLQQGFGITNAGDFIKTPSTGTIDIAGTTAVQTPTLPTVPQAVGAPPSGTEAFKRGLSAVGQDPLAFAKQNAADLALTGGGALLAGVEQSDLYPNMNKPLYTDPDAGMYRNPETGQLQLSGPNTRSLNLRDPYGYLKTAKTGGLMKYANGGIADIRKSEDMHQEAFGYGMPRLDDMTSKAAEARAATMGYANGGMTTAEMNNFGNVMTNVPTTVGNLPVSPEGVLRNTIQNNQMQGTDIGLPKEMDKIAEAAKEDDRAMTSGIGAIEVISTKTPEMTLTLEPKKMAEGGISDLENGRMLNGNGDGVSDDIPATIEGEQPAALSDGEFVVPARIVSELGNGSSDAGAKKLYKMIDRIQGLRKQTMGTKKQYAKDTNAERYLPA